MHGIPKHFGMICINYLPSLAADLLQATTVKECREYKNKRWLKEGLNGVAKYDWAFEKYFEQHTQHSGESLPRGLSCDTKKLNLSQEENGMKKIY